MPQKVVLSKNSTRTDVLLCCYGGGHVAMLAPVARQLLADGLNIEFLALTTAQAYLDDFGVRYFGYADLPEASLPAVQQLGARLAVHVPSGPVPHCESVAYLGANHHELMKTYGAEHAEELYQKHGRQAFLPKRLMHRLLDRLRPRLVITTNSPRTELALLKAAQESGTPSIAMLDMFGLQEVKWLGTPTSATRVGVINEEVRQFFIRAGCLPEQVVVTGNPAFDSVNAPATLTAGRSWREQNGLSAKHEVIVWASQVEPVTHPFTGQSGDPELPRRIEAQLREIVRRHPDWRLVVRYHPSESVEFIPEDRVILSPRSEPIHPLLHAASAVVVMTSTVGLEAYIAGTPLVAVEMSVITPDAPFARYGMAHGVSSLAQLEEALRLAMTSPRRSYGPSATACDNVVSLAKSLLN